MSDIEERILAIENMFGIAGTPLRQTGRTLVGEGVLTKMCRKKPEQRHFFLFNDILVYGSIVIPRRQLRNQHIIELEEVDIKELNDNSLETFQENVQNTLNDADNADNNNKKDNDQRSKNSTKSEVILRKSSQKNIEDIKESHERRIITESSSFLLLPYYGFVVKSPKKSFALYATSSDEKEQWILHMKQCIEECRKKRGPIGMSAIKSPVWIPDVMASKCMNCRLSVFNFLNRRHHCRCCGIVVCSACTTKRWHLPYQCATPVRVCDVCYDELKSGKHQRKSGTGTSAYLPYKNNAEYNASVESYISETSSEDSDYDESQPINMIDLTNPNVSRFIENSDQLNQ